MHWLVQEWRPYCSMYPASLGSFWSHLNEADVTLRDALIRICVRLQEHLGLTRLPLELKGGASYGQ